MKKKSAVTFFLLFITFTAFSFNWPQEQIVESDAFYSYFAQLRGNTISNSLIFAETSEIKACENGFLTVYITEHSDDSDFFPSTLGNAAVISHEDNLITVYANLDSESLTKEHFQVNEISSGASLGYSGNSAWQQGRSALEFQVFDITKNISINPRLLMPRIGKELPLSISEVKLQNAKNGKFYSLPENSSIPSGTYKVFKKRQNTAVPFKTAVSINGTIVDTISFDLLKQTDGLISAVGKKNYIKNQIYPNENLQFIGEAIMSPGKNTLKITVLDILEKQYSQTYNLMVW